jgi:hypothetical protein
MGLRPTHRDESHKPCRPHVSGDPRPVDFRFRGNDVTFDGALARLAEDLWQSIRATLFLV